MAPRRPARSGLGAVVALAVCAWTLARGDASAQTFRTFGDGLTAGHFVFYPSIALEYTDNDNVFYGSRDLPDNIIKSGVTVVRPRIMVDMPLGANRIRWIYSPLYRDYTSHNFDQTRRVSHNFDFEATHTGPVFVLRAADHYILGTVELQEVDRGGEAVFGLTPFTSYTAEVEATAHVGARSGISILPQYNSVSFDRSDTASFLSYRRRQVEVRLERYLSPTNSMFAFYTYEDTQQEREQVFFGNVSYTGRASGIGLRRTLNQEVVAFLSAGYKTIDFTGGSDSRFRGPVLEATATWQLRDTMVLSATAVHQAYQSFFVNNNYYVSSELRLGFVHQVGRSLYWESSIALTSNHYADPLDISVTAETPPGQDCNPTVPDPVNPGQVVCGGDGRIDAYEPLQPSVGRRRRDRFYRAEIGAGWQLARTLRVFLGYNAERRGSNIAELEKGQIIDPFDYSVNRIVFRMEAGWQ